MTAPDELVELWADLIAHWDDQPRHDALFAKVVTYNCYSWAAGKYKERAGDPIADKELARLRKAATATMFATATVRPETTSIPYRNAMLVLVALLILMGVGVVYAKFRTQAPQTHSQP